MQKSFIELYPKQNSIGQLKDAEVRGLACDSMIETYLASFVRETRGQMTIKYL